MGLLDRNTDVEPGMFKAYGSMGRTLGLGATGQVLGEAINELEISKYRLALLLGLHPSNCYRWFAGRCCPSSLYFGRLVQLLLWQSAGIPVVYMREILWDASLVFWRDGNITLRDHRPDGPGVMAAVDGKDCWDVAQAVVRAESQRRGQGRTDRNTPPGMIPPSVKQ